MLKLIRINLLIFVCLLLFIELTGQLIAFIKNKQFLFHNIDIEGRHQLFEPHPNLSVTLSKNVNLQFEQDKEYHSVKTTDLGTRWTGADLADTNKIRIVCIGGSTTFCTGVNDDESWPAILQEKLGNRYAVINYGVPAYKSVEAIIQLALYISSLKPEYIVFYEGGNDLYNYHLDTNKADYFYHSEVLMPMALMGTPKYESGFEKFRRQSGFFYILHNIEELFYPVKMPKRYDVPDKSVDELYIKNVRTMLTLSSAMNAREIFIGQVLNPFIDRKEKPWGIRVKKELVIPFMHQMNEMARTVCEMDSTCTYYDFQNMLQWQPAHFWDEMHFTKEGNVLFAESVKNAILQP